MIGTSAFTTAGQVLSTAGPVGLLVAVLLTGAMAWCVGETVGELVQVFRVPSAIFEYISAFVDEDIGWACGILYWYTFATVFPEEMLSAAALVRYWDIEPFWSPLIFYFLAPLGMVGLNLCPVYVYGWVETVGGVLKTILLFVVSGCMFAVSRQGRQPPLTILGIDADIRWADGRQQTRPYVLKTVRRILMVTR